MEKLTNIKEHRNPAGPGTQTRVRPGRARAPLYASPWMALFLILRREFIRQPRTASN